MDAAEISRRVRRLRSLMEEEGIKSVLVSGTKNVEYLTGRGVGRALVSADGCFLWVKELYRELYSGLYSSRKYPFTVLIQEKGAIKKELGRQHIRGLSVDDVSHSGFLDLRKDLGSRLGTTDLVERQRAVKSGYEIMSLRKSCRIAVEGMRAARRIIRPGVRETDAASEIEYAIRRSGSDSPPFDEGMLLSSGPSSADVHAKAGSKRIRLGTTVVVDLGARFSGYYSDMTRTLVVGSVDHRTRDLLEFVGNLRDEAIDMLRPGISGGEIHGFMEKEIESRGYRLYHGGGHGVGLNIHELPSISKDSEDVLGEGMVFTIEPGIYIPRRLGIRFEDTVLLRKEKAEVLTKTRW